MTTRFHANLKGMILKGIQCSVSIFFKFDCCISRYQILTIFYTCWILLQRERVEQLLLESSANCAILCHNLKKVYPGRDGNPQKFAVRDLSLALQRGECFGMLGPNGAGKTSFINMVSIQSSNYITHNLIWDSVS